MIAFLHACLYALLGLLRRLRYWPDGGTMVCSGIPIRARNVPKPDWVAQEILRMKALMPGAGCRSLELAFNRRFARVRGVSVGKTYVARVLSAHRYAVQKRSREARVQGPKLWPHNLRWGVDLTSIRSASGRRYWISGVIEYRSRVLLMLIVLIRKTASMLVRILASAFARHGAPSVVEPTTKGLSAPAPGSVCLRASACTIGASSPTAHGKTDASSASSER